MRKTPGIVRDIRTGRALAHTSSLTETFSIHVQHLLDAEEQFYLVHGRIKHWDVRCLITDMRDILEDVPIIYDPQMGSDRIYIFSGDPAELGFAV